MDEKDAKRKRPKEDSFSLVSYSVVSRRATQHLQRSTKEHSKGVQSEQVQPWTRVWAETTED